MGSGNVRVRFKCGPWYVQTKLGMCKDGERDDVQQTARERVAEDQYEKIINQGLRTMGKRIWHPATTASGKRTAQAVPGI